MSKKKSSVALFEVMSRSRDSQEKPDLSVPEWMKRRQEQQASETSAPPQRPAPEAQPRPQPQERAGSQPVSASTAGGRLDLSLSYVSCIVAGVALVVLLGGAFWLGRVSAGAGGDVTQASVGGGGQQTAPQQAAGGNGSEPAAAPERIPGKHYLVIQQLADDSAGSRQEAQRIVEFLAEQGELAEARRFRAQGRDYWTVWSLQPFDSPNSQGAIDYARKIERLGQEYFEQYRTYKFQQRRSPDAELAPWYVPYRGQ